MILAMLFFLSVGATAGSNVPTQPEPRFSLTISTPRATVKNGSEVRLKIVLKNISDVRIPVLKAVGDAQGEFNYDVDIRDGQGKLLPDTKYGKAIKNGEGHVFSEFKSVLEPGESAEDEIVLTRLYDLSRLGTHTIQVQRWDVGSKTKVKSNKISITVVKGD